MADPALNLPQTPEDRQKAETIAPHEEAWLKDGEKIDAEHAAESIGERDERMAKEGMARINELGKNLNLQAEAGAQEFAQETKSVWGRVKERLFKKKEEAPVKGEAEILAEIEKSNQAYADFKKKYQEILASGDEAGMRGLESDLSKTYEVLAAAAAQEGAADSKAWKKALKTGKEPEMTVVGAQLNDVTRRLMEVRGKLGAAAPKAEAPAPAAAKEAEEEIFNEAERAQLLADAEKLKTPAPEPAPAAPEAPANPLKKDFGEGGLAGAEAQLERQGIAALEGKPQPAPSSKPAERVPSLNEVLTGIPDAEPAAEKPSEDFKAVLRAELERSSAGLPGAKMVDDYLALEGLKADEYGAIASKAFDPRKGEIRVTYADKSELRKYSTGKMMRVYPGGKIEEILVPGGEVTEKPRAEIVDEPADAAERPETSVEDRERLLEDARSKAEALLKARDPRFTVAIHDLKVTPDDPAKAPYDVRALRISHPEDPKMNWTMEVAEDPAEAMSRLEKAIQKTYDEKISARTPVVSGETSGAAPLKEPVQEERVIVAPEATKLDVITSEQAPVASGEIVSETELPVEDSRIESEVPASSTEPVAALEAPPVAEAKPEAAPAPTPEQIAKAKKSPLAPESLPAIVAAMQGKKFNTPGSLRDALDAAGFEFPTDIEPEDPKRLHEAYKKATRPRKG